MNDFHEMLIHAKENNKEAMLCIIEMYRPLLIKNALVNNSYDEDLYEELVHTLIQCIRTFKQV